MYGFTRAFFVVTWLRYFVVTRVVCSYRVLAGACLQLLGLLVVTSAICSTGALCVVTGATCRRLPALLVVLSIVLRQLVSALSCALALLLALLLQLNGATCYQLGYQRPYRVFELATCSRLLLGATLVCQLYQVITGLHTCELIGALPLVPFQVAALYSIYIIPGAILSSFQPLFYQR